VSVKNIECTKNSWQGCQPHTLQLSVLIAHRHYEFGLQTEDQSFLHVMEKTAFTKDMNWKTQVIIASIASGTISTSAKPVWRQGCHPNILMKYLQGHHHQQYYPERLLKSTLNWTLHIQWQVPQKFLEDHSETKPRSKLVNAATQNHRTPQVIHLQDNQVKCQTSYQ